MREWTIGKRIGAGFAVMLLMTAGLGVYIEIQQGIIVGSARSLTEDSLPGIELTGSMESLARVNLTLSLKFVHAATPEEKARLEAEMRAVTARIAETTVLYEKTIFRPEDRRLFEVLVARRAEFLRLREVEVLEPSRRLETDRAIAAMATTVEPAFDRFMAACEALSEFNRTNGDAASATVMRQVDVMRVALLVGFGALLAAGSALGYLIARGSARVLESAAGDLDQGARQVAAASQQVAASSQQLSSGATEQAASLEETSASLEEMASMTRQNAENSLQAATLMAEVDQQVRSSNAALSEMVTSMTSIQDSSTKVSKIIKTIDEIAFQTNILALNAAVEAARAGEAGMGFAVVADEVRSLAQRSAQAARDTAGLIEESSAKAAHGSTKVELVVSAIAAITGSVTRVKGLVDEVSVASRQQAQGIDQVSQAVAQMEKVTQSTAATAEESAAASEELSAQAEASIEVVQRLQALARRSDRPAVSRARPAGPASPAAAHRPAPAPAPRHPRPAIEPAAARQSAEEFLPLEDTGTFGSF